MARTDGSWFEYRGRSSREFSVRLMDGNVVPMPAARGKAMSAARRSGDIWVSDGALGAVEIARKVRVPMSKYGAMAAWLDGSGLLRFSFMPQYAYDTRFNRSGSGARAIDFRQVTRDPDPLLEGTLVFDCQPFRYHYPAADDIEVTASGTIIENPGTAPSQPRVVIKGDGAFSVTIGTGADAVTMFFRGVEGGIIVDSLLGDALTYDGALLANDKIGASELFTIQPGSQAVTWINGGDADDGTELPGSIEKITITPRWCSL